MKRREAAEVLLTALRCGFVGWSVRALVAPKEESESGFSQVDVSFSGFRGELSEIWSLTFKVQSFAEVLC